MTRTLPLLAIIAPLALAGCDHKVGDTAPPRVDTPVQLPTQSSTIVVPVTSSLDALAAALDAKTPKTLWRIDERKPDCVPAKRVDLGIAKVKVVPRLGCRIVGQVTRGPIALGGHGETLDITFPVHATISARDVGGVLKQETATGAATVHAVATLGIVGDWRPSATVLIAYDWTQSPGIDFLGQRIEFTGAADEKLKPVIARLQRDLPQELARLDLRTQLAGAWRQGFTSIMLNRDNPPAWMRVTPRHLGVGGYRVAGRRLELTLSADALTETFVGQRPADPPPTPLPPPAKAIGARGLNFFIPVLADYAQLEPVVARALRKLAAKGITLKGVGPVDATFGKVTIYATTDSHLAVGVQASAKPRSGSFGTTKGEIWLTAIPYNAQGSQVVHARDVALAGQTDSTVANLLVTLFSDSAVRASIQDGLTHDFGKDYRNVLAKARAAIGERREGDFILSADVTSVRNGAIRVTGQGLFLPVHATGKATITYRPTK